MPEFDRLYYLYEYFVAVLGWMSLGRHQYAEMDCDSSVSICNGTM